jgi:hypothetical protein
LEISSTSIVLLRDSISIDSIQNVLRATRIKELFIVQSPVLKFWNTPSQLIWIPEVFLIPFVPGDINIEELGITSEESTACAVLIN